MTWFILSKCAWFLMALNQETFEDIHCNMKNIRFYLPHYDIPQLSSNLCFTLWRQTKLEYLYFSISDWVCASSKATIKRFQGLERALCQFAKKIRSKRRIYRNGYAMPKVLCPFLEKLGSSLFCFWQWFWFRFRWFKQFKSVKIIWSADSCQS